MALSSPVARAIPIGPTSPQPATPIARQYGASGSWSPAPSAAGPDPGFHGGGGGQFGGTGSSGSYTPNQDSISGILGLTGILGSSSADQQNSKIAAQEQALGSSLLQPVSMGGGGGGGNGAAAGIANAIAGLQNQQHDLDINQIMLQLRQLPGIGQQNLADYHTSLGNIAAQQNAAKLQRQQNVTQLLQDATARGAMTAAGTGTQQSQYGQNLANQLAQLHAQTQNAASQYNQNRTSLGKTYGQLVTDLQKMQIQKQIEAQQAKAAGLGGGGGGNPLAGLASFMQRMSVSQQLSQLEGQQLNPFTQQQQFLAQYGQIASIGGTDMANSWLQNMLQSYGISFAGFAPGLGTQIQRVPTGGGHVWH